MRKPRKQDAPVHAVDQEAKAREPREWLAACRAEPPGSLTEVESSVTCPRCRERPGEE